MLSNYAKAIEWANERYPKHRILDSLGPNQVASKQWLMEELKQIKDLQPPWYLPDGSKSHTFGNNVEIVGSWYGFPMIQALTETILIHEIRCWDIDFEARMIAEFYDKLFDYPFPTKVYNQDYFGHKRDGSQAHLLINTSSEHMLETFADISDRWGFKRPGLPEARNFFVKDPVIVIQSNNMRNIGEHINCVDSTEELINKHRISRVMYQGERSIMEWEGTEIKPNPQYKRFMVIGKL